MNDYNLLGLLQISDTSLPIGGYSHSFGLETYVQSGIVKDRDSAGLFVSGMLEQSIKYTDAALLSLAFDAAANHDLDLLISLDHECNAVKSPMEIRQGSQKMGIRINKIFFPLVDNELVNGFMKAIERKDAFGHYCISFGLYSRVLNIEKHQALTGFFYNAAAGMVTNCVKLVPLSQQSGQQILFNLHSAITQQVSYAMNPDKEKIGICCPGFDIRCMQHERLYSRLYMS